MSQPWDYIAKLVCIGDSGTGKSSLTIRLCEGRFSAHHDVTIGVEFDSRIVPVGPPASLQLEMNDPRSILPAEEASKNEAKTNGAVKPQKQKKMKLSLWDTAGQETYRSITRSYFRGASAAILVFDLTRRDTFLSATTWLRDLRQIAEDDIVVVLVGNKLDLITDSCAQNVPVATGVGKQGKQRKRAVTFEEAEAWCLENGVLRYIETSAKSGENVERAFLEVAERIFRNIEAGKYDLNDRRSGVKVPGAAGGARQSGGGEITLGVTDAMASKGGRAWGMGCC